MGMLSALIDDAIDSAQFEGSIRPSPASPTLEICPICRAKITIGDLDSHVFNIHRHGLLLHSADGDSRFRKAIRERQNLSSSELLECLEFCMQALTLYAKGDISWDTEKRLALAGKNPCSNLKAAFIQLLYLIHSEDRYHSLSFRRYEELKHIYPRLHSLTGTLGAAARAVIEIYFDWYECIASSRGLLFDVARLFHHSSHTDLRSPAHPELFISRSISICAPNQMIKFINLASKVVNTEPAKSSDTHSLISETIDFYHSCPSIYKPKGFFLAASAIARSASAVDLELEHPSHAILVDVYGIEA